jgi:hypothetical protein
MLEMKSMVDSMILTEDERGVLSPFLVDNRRQIITPTRAPAHVLMPIQKRG